MKKLALIICLLSCSFVKAQESEKKEAWKKYYSKYDRHLVLSGSYGPLLNTTELSYKNPYYSFTQVSTIRSRSKEYLTLAANYKNLSLNYSFSTNVHDLADSILSKFKSYSYSHAFGRFYVKGLYRKVTGISIYDVESDSLDLEEYYFPGSNETYNTTINLLGLFIFKKGYSYTVPYSNTYKMEKSAATLFAYTQPYYFNLNSSSPFIPEIAPGETVTYTNGVKEMSAKGIRLGMGYMFHLSAKHFFWAQSGGGGIDLHSFETKTESGETKTSVSYKPAMTADFIFGWNFDYFFFSYAFNFQFNMIGNEEYNIRNLYFVNSVKAGFRIPVKKES